MENISGLRDILIHSYFNLDGVILSDVVENKIPELKIQIEYIIEDLTNTYEPATGFVYLFRGKK